ncbi:beta-hydroxyacyl-acyl carrier protein (ACP) dehydratase FabZ [Psychroflexus torquis ATCC 700755]|uniref:Beta-hydroxyacyl-acyl carrier protein (ACP) dehydratase FabZ n=1 Tax=Psychroflexus torquis (strain ATCC 700755 / CIP 106069 / ACAM 623) TaxID=313595 RepID=K4ICA5_PSYTT|nr:FabA/FabZ family ACP-dehydratase [Psychroflexus torquis]AFU67503.1 beta-hydroxyacyl-acyl carrier protein (ACP) dehydratase FabZ [Psychroflexus torquis ATCC 700755]
MKNKLISQLPYQDPFLFVDTIENVSEDFIKGSYTFKASSWFYKGHFKDHPITPGVILTECAAQIGLASLGLFILSQDKNSDLGKIRLAMTSTNIEFLKPVLPDEKVIIEAEKIYFRFNKLKSLVKMFNINGDLILRGDIAGVILI